METVHIEVCRYATGNLDHDDGRRLYNAMHRAADQGDNITLDFAGMDIITPSVLNTSLCVIADRHGEEFPKTRIKIVNSNPTINRTIRSALTDRTAETFRALASQTDKEHTPER